MGYTDQTKLEAAFGATEILQLTDRNRSGVPDADVLEAAIASASDMIDGYLRAAGYTVPLDPNDIPQVVVDVTNTLVRATLYVHKKPQQVLDDAKAAFTTLRDIQAGRLKPFPSTDAPPDSPGTVDYSARDEVYSDDALEGY